MVILSIRSVVCKWLVERSRTISFLAQLHDDKKSLALMIMSHKSHKNDAFTTNIWSKIWLMFQIIGNWSRWKVLIRKVLTEILQHLGTHFKSSYKETFKTYKLITELFSILQTFTSTISSYQGIVANVINSNLKTIFKFKRRNWFLKQHDF